MDQRPTSKDAFHKIIGALSSKNRDLLKTEIEILTQLVEPKPNPVTSFWNDPERSAKTRAAMKESGKARRIKLRVTWRSSGREEIADYAEVSNLVGRAEMTVRIAISKGNGVAYFNHNDDAITVKLL